jgi:hypothetical protein
MSTGAPPDKVEVEVCNPRIADKGGHVEYECIWIMSQILPGTLTPTTLKWSVFRRYKEFAVVETSLKKQYGSAVTKLIFPPKQIFGTTDPQFIMERCRNLQDYLSNALKVCYGCTSFGVTHLESKSLREFMKYDDRLSLAPLPPGILATVNSALGTNIQPALSTLASSVSSNTPTKSSSSSTPNKPTTTATTTTTPNKSNTTTGTTTTTTSTTPNTNNTTTTATSASPSTTASPTTSTATNNASRTAAMRRLQSRSNIISTISTAPQIAPVATVQGPNLAALPSSLPSNNTNQNKTITAPSLTSSGNNTVVVPNPSSSSQPAVRPPTVTTTVPPPTTTTTTVAATVPLPMSPTPAPNTSTMPRPPGPPGPPSGPPRPPGMPQPPTGGPPKPPTSIVAVPEGAPDRSSLLSSIRGGAKLKKAVTNDRSGPKV